jgi:hypothetical protein
LGSGDHGRRDLTRQEGNAVDTYNIYMDEAAADGLNGDTDLEVNFRIVASAEDSDNAEENAVIVGLDLIDLLNLRDAVQVAIDEFTLMAFEAAVSVGEGEGEELP